MFKFTDWYKTGNLKIGSPIVGGITKFLYKFTGNTVTNPDGTRSLVNSGTSGVNADLYTGQGLKFGGVQQLDTGLVPPISSDFTILFEHTHSSVNNQFNGVYLGGSTFYYGVRSNNSIELVGSNNLKVIGSLVAGTNYLLTMRYIASTGTMSILVDASQVGVATGKTLTQGTEPMTIGGIKLLSNYNYNTTTSDHFFIPQALTDAQIQAHYENPERTWYKDSSGDVQSDILSQATITAMQGGTGFIYLLNKFTTDGTNWYTNNLCLPEPNSLVTDSSFDDPSAWTDSHANWTISNGVATMGFTTSYTPLAIGDSVLLQNVAYVLEVDVLAIGAGDLKFRTAAGDIAIISSVGKFRVSYTPSTEIPPKGVFLSRSTGTSCTIDNMNIYLATEYPYKVITGMSSDTLITNADQLPYGYQNALVNDDLTLKVIDWQATDNADLTSQALAENNLDAQITGDPATNIKVYEV